MGSYGKGVIKVYERLCRAGLSDVTLKLYDNCRHEIHNDSCRADVIKDIISFIEK